MSAESEHLRVIRDSQRRVTLSEAQEQARRVAKVAPLSQGFQLLSATVVRDGCDVPLIGVPVEAVMEKCDEYGDDVGLSKAVFGARILCPKCESKDK